MTLIESKPSRLSVGFPLKLFVASNLVVLYIYGVVPPGGGKISSFSSSGRSAEKKRETERNKYRVKDRAKLIRETQRKPDEHKKEKKR